MRPPVPFALPVLLATGFLFGLLAFGATWPVVIAGLAAVGMMLFGRPT